VGVLKGYSLALKISSFLSLPVNYRNDQLLPPAHLNLKNAMPKLVYVTGMLEQTENEISARLRQQS
jgi:hypothetical protein